MNDLLTARQLQDLLRIDRVTIYRMLNDGRLRGFKVGGQWRFPRREIEAWLLEQQSRLARSPTHSLRTVDPLSSAQVLPMTCVQAIQAVCAEALDVAVVTTGLDGIPAANISGSCGFCDLILSTAPGRLRCAGSWSQQPDGQLRPCHAGLLCASAPILVGGQPVAIVAACQFVVRGKDAESAWQLRLPDLASSLGLRAADLRAAAGSVRALPEKRVARVPRLVQRIAATFAEIGQERWNLLGRLEKIAEMSRI